MAAFSAARVSAGPECPESGDVRNYISIIHYLLCTLQKGLIEAISAQSICRSPSKNGTQLPHGDGTCLMTTSVESVAFNSMGPVQLVNFLVMIVHFVCFESSVVFHSKK